MSRLKISTIAQRVHYYVQKALKKGFYLKAWLDPGYDDPCQRCVLSIIAHGDGSKVSKQYYFIAAKLLGISVDEARCIEAGFECQPVRMIRQMNNKPLSVSKDREEELWLLGRLIADTYGALTNSPLNNSPLNNSLQPTDKKS
jgi:hypothetical protein